MSKGQQPDVGQHADDKRFVARGMFQSLANRPHGDRFGQRATPVPRQNVGRLVLQQAFRKAEAQDEQLERLNAQHGDGLRQVGNRIGQTEKRAVDRSQHLGSQRGILLDAGFQLSRVDTGPARQIQ